MNKLKEYLFFPLILIIAVLALYHNVVDNEFSGLDDQIMIEENWDELTQLDRAYTAFFDDVYAREKGSYYRPIQVLSYIPDAFFETSPTPSPRVFFYGNILLFAINSVLVFLFLSSFNLSANYRLVFTLLYTIHPALTPGISWIPGRVDVVLSIFAIISLWSFIRYLKTQSIWWVLIHLLFFTLGLFNKETSIVIPFISVLLYIYFSPLFEHYSSFRELFTVKFLREFFQYIFDWLKLNLVLVISWVAITIIWYILRKIALHDDLFSFLGIMYQLSLSWIDLIVLTGATIIPFQLQVYLDITFWYILLAIPGSFLFFYLPYRLKTPLRNVVFGYAWFFIFIYPTTLADLVNYHRLTIPIIGLAFLLSPLDKKNLGKPLLFTLGIIGVFFLYENIQFQKAFNTPKDFWENAQSGSPHDGKANSGLAWCYHIEHVNDSAMYYYKEAIINDPELPNIRISMALLEEEDGNIQQTDSLFLEELKYTRDSSFVHYYLGQILLERGDTSNALLNLEKGYSVTTYTRNARQYYDTLDITVKNQLNLNLN